MRVKEIPLTFEQVNESIAYDPLTGIFTWKKAPSRRHKVGAQLGNIKSRKDKRTGETRSYLYVGLKFYQVTGAQTAWLLTYGEWPKTNILFKDGDSLNLRIDNLKESAFPSIITVKNGRKNYKMSKESMRHHGLRKYGVSLETYNVMLAAQNGVCAICKNPETGKTPYGGPVKPLSVDHNHVTKEVRGLLCTQCNYMIGHCREDRDYLLAGVEYLDRYSGLKRPTPKLEIVRTEATATEESKS